MASEHQKHPEANVAFAIPAGVSFGSASVGFAAARALTGATVLLLQAIPMATKKITERAKQTLFDRM
jgi:hypothetical protein